MPINAGVNTTIPDASIPTTWSAADVGTISATWTDPSGVVYQLSNTSDDLGYFTTYGIAGWGSTPFEYVADASAGGGEIVRFVRSSPARITWPLHIWGDTHMQFIQRYRALRRAFVMTAHRGVPGWLTVYRPDGSARKIAAFYEEGFAGEPGQMNISASPVLTLYCPDGAWIDVQETVETRVYTSGAAAFFSPFPSITNASVLGLTSIDNIGDLKAWPTWTVQGPMSSLVATNLTTSQSFTLTQTLTLGQSVTITTDRPTVRDNADHNIIGAINWPTATLWGLETGVNSVNFAVTGAGDGTSVRLAYYPRYEGC